MINRGSFAEYTDEGEILKFCGFEFVTIDDYKAWHNPEGKLYSFKDIPPLNMNFFFKYVVPKLAELEYVFFIEPVCDANFSMVGMQHIFTGKKIWVRLEWFKGDPNLAWQEALSKLIYHRATTVDFTAEDVEE